MKKRKIWKVWCYIWSRNYGIMILWEGTAGNSEI